jgi:hypothetical protein
MEIPSVTRADARGAKEHAQLRWTYGNATANSRPPMSHA